MTAGLFGRIDQLPAFVDGQCGWDFADGMFALFHGINGDRRMEFPVGAAIDQVNIIAFAYFFPFFFTAIKVRFGKSGVGQDFLGSFEVFRNDIA